MASFKDGMHATLLTANAADQETQKVRLECLKGKSCLWITAPCIPGMSKTLGDRVRWARAQSVQLVCVFGSQEDPLYNVFKTQNLIDRAIFVPDLQAADAEERVVAELNKNDIKVDSVFTPYEQMVPVVGGVAELLGLVSSPKSAILTARDKHRTRVAIEKYGLATPKSIICAKLEDIESALNHVGLPVILKPSSGAGSAGVLRANTVEEAKDAFQRIAGELEDTSGLSFNPGVGINKVLMEELIVGDEVDVDILMWDSKAVFIKTVDNWPCIPPYFVETGSNHPSQLDKQVVDEIEKYAVDCLHACGFTMGAFHVEVFRTDNGPRLIEINARQGGGSLQEFYEVMYGVDFFCNFFISTFNIPINPPAKVPECVMADLSVASNESGVLKKAELETDDPRVFRATTFSKPGDKVLGLNTKTGVPSWIAEILVKASTFDECKTLIKDTVSKFQVVLVGEGNEEIHAVVPVPLPP